MLSLKLATNGTRKSPACWWILGTVILLLIRITLQNDIYFKTQPESYYYSYPDHVTIIRCEAVRVNNAGEEIPIAATPYRNGERLVTGSSLPPRHQLTVKYGVVAGVLITFTKYEDAGSKYRCMVENNEGEIVALTGQTRVLVGDGHPMMVRRVELLNQMLYSVILGWNAAPVPPDSPITGYEITVTPQDQGGSHAFIVDVSQNMTTYEVSFLEPGSFYTVTVAGVNSHGVGNASQNITVMTLRALVPEPPGNVTVTPIIDNTSASLIITWKPAQIDYEVMTPITSYLIYYGTDDTLDNGPPIVVVHDGDLSEYTVTGITIGGNLLVAVASMNSAGASQLAYSQHLVGVGCSVLTAPDNGLVSQTGIDIGSMGNYSCQQGFTLSGNESRICLDHGKWTGDQPTCIKLPDMEGSTLSSERTIVVTSVAVVLGLILVIALIIVFIIILRRKYTRMDKQHAISTFDNASPPLKRHNKPHSNKNKVPQNHEYVQSPVDPQMTLAMLSYTTEPRTIGTPPPPETTTFHVTPSPPSTTLPPSYSDLEDMNTSINSTHHGGFTNQLVHSNCSPPSEHSQHNSNDESCLQQSVTDSPLSVHFTDDSINHSSHSSSDSRMRGAVSSHTTSHNQMRGATSSHTTSNSRTSVATPSNEK